MFSNKRKRPVETIEIRKYQNIKKRVKYKVVLLKVLYQITIYINNIDKEFIKDYTRVKDKQDNL